MIACSIHVFSYVCCIRQYRAFCNFQKLTDLVWGGSAFGGGPWAHALIWRDDLISATRAFSDKKAQHDKKGAIRPKRAVSRGNHGNKKFNNCVFC